VCFFSDLPVLPAFLFGTFWTSIDVRANIISRVAFIAIASGRDKSAERCCETLQQRMLQNLATKLCCKKLQKKRCSKTVC
jgi:hypothetical protein